MADARHFCPDCGSIDLVIEDKLLVHVHPESEDTHRAKCPNCGWEGPLGKTVGAVTTDQFWDIERVGEVLLRVVSKHAAGPFVQVMEFVGLLPRKMTLVDFAKSVGAVPPDHVGDVADDSVISSWRAHCDMVDKMREGVVKAMLAASITAGFEEAERVHRIHAVKMNAPLHPMLREESKAKKEREFGGN